MIDKLGSTTNKNVIDNITSVNDILAKGKVEFQDSIPDKILHVEEYNGQIGEVADSNIGDLTQLQTNNKSNLVSSINELKTELSTLDTESAKLNMDNEFTGSNIFSLEDSESLMITGEASSNILDISNESIMIGKSCLATNPKKDTSSIQDNEFITKAQGLQLFTSNLIPPSQEWVIGPTGKFKTLSEAFKEASKYKNLYNGPVSQTSDYPLVGIYFKLEPNFKFTEVIIIGHTDMSYVMVRNQDPNTPIKVDRNHNNFKKYGSEYFHLFKHYNSRTPNYECSIDLDTNNDTENRKIGVLSMLNSSIGVCDCDIQNGGISSDGSFHPSILVKNSVLTIINASIKNCGQGIQILNGSVFVESLLIDDIKDYVFDIICGSTLQHNYLTIQNCAGSGHIFNLGSGIVSRGRKFVLKNNTKSECNIAPNTLTKYGIYFK